MAKIKKARAWRVPVKKFKLGPKHLSAHKRAKLIADGKLRLLPNGNWSMDA